MNTKELVKLLKVLRAHGAVSYEHDGMKLLLDPNFQEPLKSRLSPPTSLQEQVNNLIPQMDDDAWLLATNPNALEPQES